jgi:hypothetical protein
MHTTVAPELWLRVQEGTDQVLTLPCSRPRSPGDDAGVGTANLQSTTSRRTMAHREPRTPSDALHPPLKLDARVRRTLLPIANPTHGTLGCVPCHEAKLNERLGSEGSRRASSSS